MIDETKILENAVRDGIRDGIKSKVSSTYDSPLGKLVDKAIADQSGKFLPLLTECIATCLGDPQFRSDIAQAVRHTMAKTLIARFGGELEKQVNVLKSDPVTRARITVAIEQIVKEQGASTFTSSQTTGGAPGASLLSTNAIGFAIGSFVATAGFALLVALIFWSNRP